MMGYLTDWIIEGAVSFYGKFDIIYIMGCLGLVYLAIKTL